MITWTQLRDMRPDLADAGRGLFYQFGVGLGLLATVRPDGAPRLHPMCPIVAGDGLYAFIVPSPKCRDLIRDGRYAMHCHPPADNEDAFHITGRAELCKDGQLRAALEKQFRDERGGMDIPRMDEQELFEFFIDTCLLTRTTGHGDPDPKHTIWKAP